MTVSQSFCTLPCWFYSYTSTIMFAVISKGVTHAMNADVFRHLFGYHFAENRKIWDEYIAPLAHEKFAQEASY